MFDSRNGLVGGFMRKMVVVQQATYEALRTHEQTLRRECAMDQRFNQLFRRFKRLVVTDGFKLYHETGKVYRIDYATFYVLSNALHSLYGNEAWHGVNRSLRESERIICDGRVYLFATNFPGQKLYDGGDERLFSYERIIKSEHNPEGFMMVFDEMDLKSQGYDPETYGDSIISKEAPDYQLVLRETMQSAIDKCTNTVPFAELEAIEKASGK